MSYIPQSQYEVGDDQIENGVDIFWGGSCNPTVWRKKIAIPALIQINKMRKAAKMKPLTHYNPQRESYVPGMEVSEATAKEAAHFLVFVIDGQTRATVSMQEACEYMLTGRQVVLVVEDIKPGTEIDGQVVDEPEAAELNGARNFVRLLAVRTQSPIYESVELMMANIDHWDHEIMKAEPNNNPILRWEITGFALLDVLLVQYLALSGFANQLQVCVTPIKEGDVIEGTEMTGRRFKDFSRLPNYLRCMAERHGLALQF